MKTNELVLKLNRYDMGYFKDTINIGLERLDDLGLTYKEITQLRHESIKHMNFIHEVENFIESKGSLENISDKKLKEVVGKYEDMQHFRYTLHSLHTNKEMQQPPAKTLNVSMLAINRQ